MALTERQQRFILEYQVDGNATQAAIRAGYSADTAGSIGHENLKKPEIAAALRNAKSTRAVEEEVDPGWILRALKAEANDHGPDSSHAARVAALKVLAQTAGLLVKKVEHTNTVRGRVVIELVQSDDDRDRSDRPDDRPADPTAPGAA